MVYLKMCIDAIVFDLLVRSNSSHFCWMEAFGFKRRQTMHILLEMVLAPNFAPKKKKTRNLVPQT